MSVANGESESLPRSGVLAVVGAEQRGLQRLDPTQRRVFLASRAFLRRKAHAGLELLVGGAGDAVAAAAIDHRLERLLRRREPHRVPLLAERFERDGARAAGVRGEARYGESNHSQADRSDE